LKRLLKKFSRLRRKIVTADWTPIDPSNQDVVQVITDVMAAGTQIQIEYEGSGWRLIQPYGWNSSKEGNILLMCYKDTGEVRSYRLDRVLQVLVNSSQLNNEPVINGPLTPDNMYQVEDYKANPEDFEIPPLPNQDEVLQLSENEPGMKSPYDEGLDYLATDTVPIEVKLQDPKIHEVKIPQEQLEETEETEPKEEEDKNEG
jgi:hypothetical protein